MNRRFNTLLLGAMMMSAYAEELAFTSKNAKRVEKEDRSRSLSKTPPTVFKRNEAYEGLFKCNRDLHEFKINGHIISAPDKKTAKKIFSRKSKK